MKLPNTKEEMDRRNKVNEYIYLEEDYKSVFKGQKYFLRTYGCQMNVHDSEAIRGYLETLGFTSTEKIEDANLVLLNTCAIRENASDKVIGFLGKCKYLKKQKNDFKIVITGCLSQKEDFVNNIISKHKYIDLVIGTHNIHELPRLLLDLRNKQTIEVYSNSNEIIENIQYTRDSKYKAFVNIMYGCDKFCTYCIVPFTRGKERSRKKEDILNEVKSLKENGYKEVCLLGQNVNAYGQDIGETFSNLLEEVANTEIERIRFVTSHPWNFTDDMIDIIAKYPNIMPYIHLPIQSGSNEILKKMNRRYTKEEYLTLFKKIKEKIPNASITTDIIVGFPNETDEDFKETLDVVRTCEFDGAYTFIYSKREGTVAALMDDKIPQCEKEKRLYELNELVNYYSNKKNELLVNKIVKVLVEGISEKDNTKLYGYTDTYKLVNITGNKELIGKIIDVKITDAKSFSLDGTSL